MFKVKLKALSNKIEELPFFYFITLLALICKVSSTFLGYIAIIATQRSSYNITIDDQNRIEFLVYAILFAPIVETIIFQAGMFHILNSIPFIKHHNGRIILIGGLIFSSAHAYNIPYIIAVIPAGILYMYAYIVRQKKNDAFLSVYSIHLIFNTISLISRLTN